MFFYLEVVYWRVMHVLIFMVYVRETGCMYLSKISPTSTILAVLFGLYINALSTTFPQIATWIVRLLLAIQM